MTSRRVALGILMLCACASSLAAQGSGAGDPVFPTRTVTMIVPFPPGGGTDVLARVLAQHMQESWRQNVVVENRGGAAGRLGTQIVTRAAPDGHTLLTASTGSVMATAGPLGGTPFSVRDHLAPVTLVVAPAYVISVHPAVEARDVAGLVAAAKRRPGYYTFGSSGTGAASHLAAELFAAQAGVELLHVPYRGTGPALTDLMAGRIQLMFSPPQTVATAAQAGQVRNLAVTSERRSPLMPELPTVDESGVAGYSAVGWFGLFTTKGTPAPVVTRIHAEAARALGLASVRERLSSLGAVPEPMAPDAFAAYVDTDIAKWQRLVQDRNIPME